jgi:hypothetical protein
MYIQYCTGSSPVHFLSPALRFRACYTVLRDIPTGGMQVGGGNPAVSLLGHPFQHSSPPSIRFQYPWGEEEC